MKAEKPCGYGVVYDEGFLMDDMKTCYGKEYYSDISRVKYEGCNRNGKRFGKGTLCARNELIKHKGLWWNDKPYAPGSDFRMVDTQTVSLSLIIHAES